MQKVIRSGSSCCLRPASTKAACLPPSCSRPVRLQPTTANCHRNSPRLSIVLRVIASDVEEDLSSSPAADGDCSLVFSSVDNKSSDKYTILSVSVNAYPSLPRTVAWTLNGLGIRAQNAFMKTGDDGYAEHKYWLVDYAGKKLSDKIADSTCERIQDFVHNCQPHVQKAQEEWTCDNMHVSNTAHPDFTELVITGEPKKHGFLLEISSVLSSIGATVHEGVIQGDREHMDKGSPPDYDFTEGGRIFRFLLTDVNGRKLSPGRVASVLYMLDLVAGKGHAPMQLF